MPGFTLESVKGLTAIINDPDKVLVRWKLSRSKYGLICNSLKAETAVAGHLEHLNFLCISLGRYEDYSWQGRKRRISYSKPSISNAASKIVVLNFLIPDNYTRFPFSVQTKTFPLKCLIGWIFKK